MLQPEVIEKIKLKLESQKSESRERIEELEKTDPFNLEAAADLVDDRTSPDDEAQVNEVHERVASQVASLRNSIVRIESALVRIKNNTFGICEACGKEIEETRLSIMPLASLCLSDEKSIEKRVKKITS
ncbi:MAG: TraR/DksA C4-type zinc finger protein [bacterium]|nr:TraR/DksA C4-type zinc finger protein [bacterium]